MKPVKFPNSSQLFKFCQKVLSDQKGKKVHDQDIGSILSFNPSDCSHWKKGEKNVKSVFALEKLANSLNVEVSLIYDIASGATGLDEAYFELQESKNFNSRYKKAFDTYGESKLLEVRTRIYDFVKNLHNVVNFKTPPLYFPELFRFFPYITIQQTEIMDKLSRVLRTKPGHYLIQYRKGELKAQTRLSIALELAKIVLDGERERYKKDLGEADPKLSSCERSFFAAALLCPQELLSKELANIDSRKNIIAELATLFWVPKHLIGFQIQNAIQFHDIGIPTRQSESESESKSSTLRT